MCVVYGFVHAVFSYDQDCCYVCIVAVTLFSVGNISFSKCGSPLLFFIGIQLIHLCHVQYITMSCWVGVVL